MAFVLFDTDGDEMLAFEEVTMYIASVLRVVYAVGHDVTGDLRSNPSTLQYRMATATSHKPWLAAFRAEERF